MEAPVVVGERAGRSVKVSCYYDRKRPFGDHGLEYAALSDNRETRSIVEVTLRSIQSYGLIGHALECSGGVRVDLKPFLAHSA